MKTVKLYGYFAQNVGDDLMIDILLRRYPQYQFYCEDNSQFSDAFCRHSNFVSKRNLYSKYGRLNHILNILTCYKKRDFFFRKLFEKLDKRTCCSVYIGGSIYMEQSEKTAAERIALEKGKQKNGPLFVIGANFGPYTQKAFYEGFADYFRDCGGVCFRDQASYELFRDLPNVSVAPDVVFNLEARASENDGTALISVIDVNWRNQLDTYACEYETCIRDICLKCISEGKKPVLMSFCAGEGDENAIDRILRSLPEEKRERIESFRYNGNIEKLLNLYAKADSVIATRFHSMILAVCYGKPFYCISYSNKVIHVLEDIGSDAFCKLSDIKDISAQEMLSKVKKADNIADYIAQASAQFNQLDRYMNNG